MKIISVRQRLYPALLLPLTFSPVLQAASAPNEQTMIVTATPQTVSELDTPAAVSVIEGEDMRLATPRVNLSESLTSVPGLQVQNRQNYAQDLQISIRGFGSRSAFGVRYSSVWFDSNDHYIAPGNGDDSGDASYHHWLPAGSLKYALTDAWNLYLAAGRGFETPTINELSYRADGQSGFNFDPKPSTNDTVEVGSKTRIGNGLLTAALFQTDTDDEIVVASSMGGRTTYKNAGKTRRQGAELALDQRFAGDWRVKASWTWLDATYRSNVCQGQNCDGNRMPGIARNMGFASLGFIPDEGWYAGTDVRYMGDIMANDENTAKAPSYTVVGLNTGYKFNYSQLTVDIFGRVDNLFDKEYIGSVIVNESNGRYYEPAPGRNYGVGINLAWQFE
ncbi:TonB-dependent receptor [Salmonella enterica]|nr:TonB-dependent receptor [Salmonella enterica]